MKDLELHLLRCDADRREDFEDLRLVVVRIRIVEREELEEVTHASTSNLIRVFLELAHDLPEEKLDAFELLLALFKLEDRCEPHDDVLNARDQLQHAPSVTHEVRYPVQLLHVLALLVSFIPQQLAAAR